MKIELPESGGWVEIREKMTLGDKLCIQQAMALETTIEDDGTRTSRQDGSFLTRMRLALLGQMVTAWSFTDPVPAEATTDPGIATARAGQALAPLDLDDWNVLEEAIEPMMRKVAFTAPNPVKSSA